MQRTIDFFGHGKLGDGEESDHRAAFFDEPAILVRDGFADGIEVEREGSGERLAFRIFEDGEADAVLGEEQVGERGVDRPGGRVRAAGG